MHTQLKMIANYTLLVKEKLRQKKTADYTAEVTERGKYTLKVH